ncbi:MAG TPA: Hsp20/alpha crystallin family protein [Kiritimatiellia bacterium]|mgnify:CR=1 FL=1|nr:Hsp20/alpha crystallin family protein [Kiritimatiellia bacterium]HNS79870.1 Hsp20/alpha crystallin family protein [Kiritimatiellia bacterium]HPA77043.1 Hsp20/alpha crystallin family protein [Kiritimatiellia bacterium]HQQ05256.1 Hsp20/alpha crystallin family protein [Kiritimatiellia bacterium]
MYLPEYRMTGWEPFSGLRALQREMDSLLDGYSHRSRSDFAVNVWSNGEKAVVSAELPGCDAADIEISTLKDFLTITGKVKQEETIKDAVCHRAERSCGEFSRTIRLPFEVEQDKAKASYSQGVLTVELARAEASKPQKIKIESA